MFRPMFVYDSTNCNMRLCERMRSKDYHMVDVREHDSTVKTGGNPVIVIYDIFGQRSMHENHDEWDRRFSPPSSTAVMIFFGEHKGHIRGRPNPLAAIREITGREVVNFVPHTGNFRLGAKI